MVIGVLNSIALAVGDVLVAVVMIVVIAPLFALESRVGARLLLHWLTGRLNDIFTNLSTDLVAGATIGDASTVAIEDNNSGASGAAATEVNDSGWTAVLTALEPT